MSPKEKFPLYLSPEKKATLERRYQEDGSRSITGFIENAIDFYLDYLSANNSGLFLPSAVQSYICCFRHICHAPLTIRRMTGWILPG
ncbi:hypothetical protein [Pseudoflavonifractor phocaeensis]|uniref:hypothetical protein n=1 Tax=Pseudoflavonifractor phocaeensis TaxID=1870988 RepID=UPI001FB00EF8|nr:hypothetical protein [Pseudoflavonifractor phocaeensis]